MGVVAEGGKTHNQHDEIRYQKYEPERPWQSLGPNEDANAEYDQDKQHARKKNPEEFWPGIKALSGDGGCRSSDEQDIEDVRTDDVADCQVPVTPP